MFDDAANALEEIEPEDKTRNEVLYARVDIYLGDRKWHMAAAVASYLVKADPKNPAAWINLAYAVRRAESIEHAEAILLKARALHPENALIAFNLACYASAVGHMEKAKARLQEAIEECLARELDEELGIRTRIGCAESSHQYEHGSFRIVAYFVDRLGGNPRPSVHDRLEWVKIRDINGYQLLPADIPIAASLQELKELA